MGNKHWENMNFGQCCMCFSVQFVRGFIHSVNFKRFAEKLGFAPTGKPNYFNIFRYIHYVCEICFVCFMTYLSMEAIFRHSCSMEVTFSLSIPRKQRDLMSFPIAFGMQRAIKCQVRGQRK